MLSRIIPYTTRPIRDGETQDKDYHFCNEEDVKRLSAQGRIIELREYNTVYGVWKYFTVNDDDIDLRCQKLSDSRNTGVLHKDTRLFWQ